MAECVCASLTFTPFIDVPCLICVDSKYLNWSTSSSVFPFIPMLVNGYGLMLLTRGLLLSELFSVPVSSSCFIRSFSELLEFSLLPSGSMSSANYKLQSGRPLMDSDDSGVSILSASPATSSAKQSFSNL